MPRVPRQSTGALTVSQLRERCAEQNLPQHGRRNALIARLQYHTEFGDRASQPHIDVSNRASVADTSTPPDTAGLSEAKLDQVRAMIQAVVPDIMQDASCAAIKAYQ